MKKLHFQLSDDWKKKIRFSTLSFLFIIAYVNIFPMLFGAENNIVAVIFTILMSASMVRDLTGTILRHFFIQTFVLIWMSIAACTVSLLHQTQKAAKKSRFLRGFLFTAYSSAFSLSVLS